MVDSKPPRKIIGMNRKSTMNTTYIPETLAEFLYDYKGAWTDAARKNPLKWTATPAEDKHRIWPSQVFLYSSLSVEEDVYQNVNLKQDQPIVNLKFKEQKQGHSKIFDQIEPTNNVNSMEWGRSSDLNNFSKLEIDIKDTLKALFLSCAEDGERIARIHSCRPFFKKIDCLCERTKQDLNHHDTVIPHVNAQGMTWAIKDLIFVSTRIINAWNITKGYVYDSSDGLSKVRSTLSSGFISNFIAWQEITHKFMASIMMSFLSLNILVQTSNNSPKRSQFFKELYILMQGLKKETKKCNEWNNTSWMECDCAHCKIILSSIPTHNALLELSAHCSEYGEKVAQNYMARPYFRKVDALCNRTKIELKHGDGALSNLNSQGTVWAIKELIFASTRIINAWNITKGYVYGSSENLKKVQMGLSCDFVPNFSLWQEATKDLVENLRISFIKLHDLTNAESFNLKKNAISKPIKVFKDNLQQMKSAEVFFRALFCRNYFPDFIAQTPDFMDIHSIVKKCQNNGYNHINEVVHDVKFTIYQVRKYLMRNTDPNLDRAVSYLEGDVNKVLAQKMFKDFRFGHIEGKPNEILFVYN